MKMEFDMQDGESRLIRVTADISARELHECCDGVHSRTLWPEERFSEDLVNVMFGELAAIFFEEHETMPHNDFVKLEECT